jgi:integrase
LKPTLDPYGHEERYDAAKRNLESASNIKPADKQAILSFTRELLLNNITKARATKYLYHLTVLARNKKPTFNDCTRKEIEKLVDWLNSQPYSDYTRSDYLIVLKRFLQFLRGCDPNEHEYPGEVKWIRVRRKRKRILPETLLTREDLKRLLDATENTRDRALVLTHYESGCRIGEILSLRIQNVQFDQQGAVLIVNGKTGTRRVRIVSAKTALAEWLSIHPKRNDPANYVWIGIGTVGRYKPLSYESVRRIYRNLTKRAGLSKRVYTHLFRHTRATELAKSLTEAEMKEYLGWVQDSRMASNYVHLSGRDIDAAILRASGKSPQEQSDSRILKSENCRDCGREVSLGYIHCPYCGSQQRPNTKTDTPLANNLIAKVVKALISDEETQSLIRRKIQQISSCRKLPRDEAASQAREQT